MKDDDTKEIGVKSLEDHLSSAKDWLCTGLNCGKRPFEGGMLVCVADWRWDGKNWQHQHAYPVGHLICEYKPMEEKPK